MGLVCECGALSLPAIGATQCGTSYGQLQVMAFVKLGDLPSTLSGDSVINIKSTWTDALTATTPKVVMSPVLYNPQVGPGDVRTFGGGNATPDGIAQFMGAEPTEITAELRKISPAVANKVHDLICMAEAGLLGMYMFDADGNVIGKSATSAIDPIPVRSLFISDRVMGNYEEPDYHNLTINLEEGWSFDLKTAALDHTASNVTANWRGLDLLASANS